MVPPSPTARLAQMWLLRVEVADGSRAEVRLPDPSATDHALRIDLVEGLLQACRVTGDPAQDVASVRVVLHRPGSPDPREGDHSWWGAASTALAARGLQGTFWLEVGVSCERFGPRLG